MTNKSMGARVSQLYRDCLKLAQFIAARDGGNLEGMRKQVRALYFVVRVSCFVGPELVQAGPRLD